MQTKHRLIASILWHRGQVVQTRKFKPQNVIGNALTAVDFFNSWAIDEIILLDISPTDKHYEKFIETAEELSRRCFVPLTVGGNLKTLEQAHHFTRVGADKVVVNSEAFRNPDLIKRIADSFGNQCVVVSVDGTENREMKCGYEVVIDHGKNKTGFDLIEWVKTAVNHGAGELLINSLDRDGDRRGYDLELMKKVVSNVPVPVIAFGGVNEWQHLVDGIEIAGVQAVAAGNVFHYVEQSTKKAKEYMENSGLRVRAASFYDVSMPRHPKYRPF